MADGEGINAHGPGECFRCPKRDKCTTLCSEAEAIVDQDHVQQREMLLGDTKYSIGIKLLSNIYLTQRERAVVTLLGQGLDRRDVCELLEITRHNLRNILLRIRQKL